MYNIAAGVSIQNSYPIHIEIQLTFSGICHEPVDQSL